MKRGLLTNMINNVCIVSMYICFVLQSCSIHNNNSENKAFATLKKEYEDSCNTLKQNGQLEDFIALSIQMAYNSRNIGYKEGIVLSYINIATIYCNLRKNKESLEYLNNASEILENNRDHKLTSRLFTEYGRNYGLLGFGRLCHQYFSSALKEELLISDTVSQKIRKQYTYMCMATNYENNGNWDSAFVCLINAYNLYCTPIVAAELAGYYIIHKKNYDSTNYFLLQSDSLFHSSKYSYYQSGVICKYWGVYHIAKKQNTLAKEELLQALTIFKQTKRIADEVSIYKLLYQSTRDSFPQESNKYISSYSTISDSLSIVDRKVRYIPIKNITTKYESSLHKSLQVYYYILSVVLIIFIILFIRVRKKFHLKDEEKQQQLLELEEEANTLKLQVNKSFEKVITLAKEGDVNFYTRFNEIYPTLQERLLNINPNLLASELTLSAYVYLGFQTKEIAQYTYKSPKTIQNRKNTLRKRLTIPSNIDIYVWMKNL